MKKYISLLLALVMALSLCACSGDDDEGLGLEGGSNNNAGSSNTGGNTGNAANTDASAFKGRLIEPTMKLIAADTYSAVVEDPSTQYGPITFTIYGNQEMLSCTISGTLLNLWRRDNVTYVIDHANKAYVQLSKTVKNTEQQKQFEMLLELGNLKKMGFLSCSVYKSNGTATIGSETMQYEEYYNPMLQQTRRFFFDQSGTLKYTMEMLPDGTQGSLVSISVLSVTASVFDTLTTYSDASNSGSTASTTAAAVQ